MHIIYISNDNLLTLDALTNTADSSFINDATVTVTLVDSTGTEVTGETWPLAMSYVSSSNGKYQATLTDSLSLSKGTYTAQITANGGAGLLGYWEITLRALVRNS